MMCKGPLPLCHQFMFGQALEARAVWRRDVRRCTAFFVFRLLHSNLRVWIDVNRNNSVVPNEDFRL